MSTNRFFLDCEFHERGPARPIQLISLALVPDDDDDEPLYIVNNSYDWRESSDWLKQNVEPHLFTGLPTVLPFDLIRRILLDYVKARTAKPEFWGYYADYDWVVLCQCFGAMIDLPDGWPMFCMDLKQLAVMKGNPPLPKQEHGEHNALADARWNRDVYKLLTALE